MVVFILQSVPVRKVLEIAAIIIVGVSVGTVAVLKTKPPKQVIRSKPRITRYFEKVIFPTYFGVFLRR